MRGAKPTTAPASICVQTSARNGTGTFSARLSARSGESMLAMRAVSSGPKDFCAIRTLSPFGTSLLASATRWNAVW
jgi:hypothetical protein